jgi:hypothetical protein
MKSHYYVLLSTALIMTATSCKKDSSNSGGGGNQSSGLVRIQQGVDPAIINDSVYLLKYDSKNRITSVIDSIYQDTLIATYNANGQLSTIQEHNPYADDQLSATYDGSGHLTEIDYILAGEMDQYAFTYTGSMPSQCVWSTNAGSGSLFVWRTYQYTATGQNITNIKEYDKDNSFIGERRLTFGNQANPFKTLSFFNWGGRLGTDDIIYMETFFNANLTATTAWYGPSNNLFYTTNQTTTNDNSGNPTKIVATEEDAGNDILSLQTWFFNYK